MERCIRCNKEIDYYISFKINFFQDKKKQIYKFFSFNGLYLCKECFKEIIERLEEKTL